MRTCPDCLALVEDHAKFCENCGFRLQQEVIGQSSSDVGIPASSREENQFFASPGESFVSVSPGTCSACGYVNIPGETFCHNCGVQLAPVVSMPPPPPVPVLPPSAVPAEFTAAPKGSPTWVCAYCGQSNDTGERYCGNCGLQFTATSTASAILPAQQSPVETPSPLSPITTPASKPQPPESVSPAISPSQVSGKLVVQDTGAEIVFPPGKSELLIGRTDPVRNVYPDIDLAPFGGELSGVSRMHARLEIKGGEMMIEDLNSTNFTFLNRQRLQPGQQCVVHSGDEIRLGLLRLEYLVI